MITVKEKKGFTIAELLAVVAIVGILVAVSIPIFTSQLERAKLATDDANVRSTKSLIGVSLNTETVDVDGKSYNVIELSKTVGNPPGVLYYVTNDITLSTSSNDAYVLKGTRKDDTSFYYKKSDHTAGAKLMVWIFPEESGSSGKVNFVITSDAP